MNNPDPLQPMDPEHNTEAVDGRQSETALELQRGVVRVLAQHALSSVCKLPLPNGRRADVVGITEKVTFGLSKSNLVLLIFRQIKNGRITKLIVMRFFCRQTGLCHQYSPRRGWPYHCRQLWR